LISPQPPLAIEDYAMIGDRISAALVGRNGSIDWLCLPRFDGDACFAALLGDSRNGRWLIAPAAAQNQGEKQGQDERGGVQVARQYQPGTMVLETVFTTASGKVAVIDFMVPNAAQVTLVRMVRGLSGRVAMHMELALRFDFGASVPWVTAVDEHHGILAVAGPMQVVMHGPARLHGQDMRTMSDFHVGAGQSLNFVLSSGPSHLPMPAMVDANAALAATQAYWQEFSGRSQYRGKWKGAVDRSLLTLHALTYAPTGGMVAAPTTSLPEAMGSGRNWDYRFCWLRDATLTLYALMGAGYMEEAAAWRDWLQRSVAGSAAQIQIMYGLHGERRLDEWEADWLPGYGNSRPVRIGNAAAGQTQLDVFGEVLDCLYQARSHGLRPAKHGWAMQRGIVEYLETIWDKPDEGIWEVRGGAKHFTFSKVMAWVALDRMIKEATQGHLAAPLERWRAVRQQIFDSVMREGFNTEKNSFVQSYGGTGLDASLLLIPAVGFLPAKHERVRGTLAAIERELLEDGFVLRYRTESAVDGLPPGEGAFLACTFWLASAYARQGRQKEAETLFERLLDLQNDVGLLSEEYDPRAKRMLGNFPQAFSHVALVGSAMALSG
jgi:glucoamylase